MARPRRKYTVSQAKNLMRRAADEILDPGPRSIDPLWDYFASECAYCGRPLDRGLRDGHADHAEPGGGNHIGNLVLACGSCNGDEKRERPWRAFLRDKSPDETTYAEREARIIAWFEKNPRPDILDSEEVARLRAEVEDVVTAFAAKCSELKAAVGRETR